MVLGEARAKGEKPTRIHELPVRRNGRQAVLQGVVGDPSAPLKRGRGHQPERVHPGARKGIKRAVEVGDRADVGADEIEAELGQRAVDDRLVPPVSKARRAEHANACDRGGQLLEELELLGRLLGRGLEGHACDVAPGPSQAGNQPRTHGIWNAGDHDRDRVGGLLGGESGRSCGGVDNVHPRRDELPRELGQALDLALGRPVLE